MPTANTGTDLKDIITALIKFWALKDDCPENAEILFGYALSVLVRMTGYIPKRAEHQAIVDYLSQNHSH